MIGAYPVSMALLIVLASSARSAPSIESSCQADGSSTVQSIATQVVPWSVEAYVSGPMRPFVARRVLPVYPEGLRSRGIKGTVELCVSVSRSGRVSDVTVVRGPTELSPHAVAAVRKWRFRPAHMDGQAVRVRMPMTFTFSIAGDPDPAMGRPTSACSGARAARSFRLPLTPSRAPADA